MKFEASYDVCNHQSSKPLILYGYIFEGRAVRQSKSYKRVTNYSCRLYSPLFTKSLASTTVEWE